MPTDSRFDESLLPNVICIGGQRCGTAWLNAVISGHPDVRQGGTERPVFNTLIREHGIQAAYSFFLPRTQHKIRFEKTPIYSAMFPEEVATVRKLVPKAKIIFLVRNPVDRIWSSLTRSWTFSNQEKRTPSQSVFGITRAIESGLSQRLNNYDTTYRIWTKHFGNENVFVERYDKIRECPDRLLERICEFIDIDHSLLSQDRIQKRQNHSRPERCIEMPDSLRSYLSRRWLPMLRRFQTSAPIDVSDWIAKLERDSKEHFWINGHRLTAATYRAVHRTLYVPFSSLRRVVNSRAMQHRLNATTESLDFGQDV